jgi:hypothetical protein
MSDQVVGPIVMSLGGCVSFWIAITHLRNGCLVPRYKRGERTKIIPRSEHPIQFWFAVTIAALVGSVFFGIAIYLWCVPGPAQ